MGLLAPETMDISEVRLKKKRKKDKKREEVLSPILQHTSSKLDLTTGSRKDKSMKIDTVNKVEDYDNANNSRHPLNDLINQSDNSDDDNLGSPKKKKKKKSIRHEHSNKEDESHDDDDDVPVIKTESNQDHAALNDDDVEAIKDDNQDFFNGWKKEDIKELLKKMSEVIPKNDTLKYNSRVSKLNWEKVSFGSYTAQDCLNKWKVIEKKVRGYRILSELITDANDWLEKPWTDFYQSVKKNRHPDLPKRPLTSYMLFYMEKKEKFAKKHPNLEMSKLSKLMAEKFNALPEHKKEKYNALAAAMREQYHEKMLKFQTEHPEEAKTLKKTTVKKVTSAISGPKKPLTPFKMFYQDKLKHLQGVNNQTEVATLLQECKNKWNSMSSKKKIPWIRWAYEAELKYLEEVKLYCAENPDFKAPPYKSVLSKREKVILQRMDGKPEKPPNSAYSLFSRLMLKDPELKEKFETPKERLQEIARLWKEVPKAQKDEYAEKVKHLLENYKLEYATYLDSLPEEKRAEELASTMPKKRGKSDNEGQSSKKLKQTTINAFVNFFPGSETSDKKKTKSLEELIKMEPVHPPEDPFVLLKDEYLTKGLSEKRAIKAWKTLSDMEKRKYENKIDALKQEYIENFRQFLTGLKPEELNTYSAYKKQLKETVEKKSDDDDEQNEEEEEEEEEQEGSPSEETSDSSEDDEDSGDS